MNSPLWDPVGKGCRENIANLTLYQTTNLVKDICR